MAKSEHVHFLIIGAGPFGLAMSALARELEVPHVIVGNPMSFWRANMPEGMLLRSGCDWHLDPAEQDTFERFLSARGQTPSDVEPLSLPLYRDYATWFQQQKGIQARPQHVSKLEERDGRFLAELDDGSVLSADRVLVATGFATFAYIPPELARLVPGERSSHSCTLSTPGQFVGRRVLIVGGRQSAFESAALLAEAGAEAVDLSYRHDTPAFVESDWSWVTPLLNRIGADPAWYRRLPDEERRALDRRFWEEGRMKLEPWLAPRLDNPTISLHANSRMVRCDSNRESMDIALSNGETVTVDHVLFATGYKVQINRVSFLARGNLLERIRCEDGGPCLSETLETTVPGLHITSLPATRDFGLFFAFTAAVRASARIMGRVLSRPQVDPH